jgi:hypothetical protein
MIRVLGRGLGMPTETDLDHEIHVASGGAGEAGGEILKIYQTDSTGQFMGRGEPVTEADWLKTDWRILFILDRVSQADIEAGGGGAAHGIVPNPTTRRLR